MLISHSHSLLSFPFPFSHSYNPLLSLALNFIHRPTSLHSVSAHSRPIPDPWLAQAVELTAATTTAAEEGSVELPSFSNSIFAYTDDPSPIQVATSVLLTGAVSVFLFRSVRRRAKRAKELKFRSSGAKESLNEEAMDSLKAMGSASIETKSPSSALQVQQITITIRTIVNGLCLPCNPCFRHQLGLYLYSGRLALNSIMEDSSTKNKGGEEKISSPDVTAEGPISGDSDDNRREQSSDGNNNGRDDWY